MKLVISLFSQTALRVQFEYAVLLILLVFWFENSVNSEKSTQKHKNDMTKEDQVK